MAREVVIKDDLTGESGAEAHVIIIDGVGVEIDLAGKSFTALTKVLAPYFEAGAQAEFQVSRFEGKRKVVKASTNGHGAGSRPNTGRRYYEVSTDDIVAHIAKHPGTRTIELAEYFNLTSGTIAYRLNPRRDVRAERRTVDGSRGQPQQHWYPV